MNHGGGRVPRSATWGRPCFMSERSPHLLPFAAGSWRMPLCKLHVFDTPMPAGEVQGLVVASSREQPGLSVSTSGVSPELQRPYKLVVILVSLFQEDPRNSTGSWHCLRRGSWRPGHGLGSSTGQMQTSSVLRLTQSPRRAPLSGKPAPGLARRSGRPATRSSSFL